jgi:hypothetical protein
MEEHFKAAYRQTVSEWESVGDAHELFSMLLPAFTPMVLGTQWADDMKKLANARMAWSVIEDDRFRSALNDAAIRALSLALARTEEMRAALEEEFAFQRERWPQLVEQGILIRGGALPTVAAIAEDIDRFYEDFKRTVRYFQTPPRAEAVPLFRTLSALPEA